MHRLARPLAQGLAFGLALAVAGCGAWRATTVPLRTIEVASACPTRPDTLIAMLPGSYSVPEDFVEEGFVEAVRARGIAADLRLVDAHLGYYRERSILERLRIDVLEPARAAGYRHVWLAGISIGAYGALGLARTLPGAVDGAVLIGPYLGTRDTTAAIAAQGGLAAWTPPPDVAPDDLDTDLWRWLQATTRPGATEPRPALLLGFGADDRFAFDQRLLGSTLPPGRVFVAPGGHAWAPWRTTWAQILDAAPLPRDARCAVAATR